MTTFFKSFYQIEIKKRNVYKPGIKKMKLCYEQIFHRRGRKKKCVRMKKIRLMLTEMNVPSILDTALSINWG